MSRTYFEFGPTQINKSTPVDSDVELNQKKIETSAVFRSSYALGLAHEKLGV